MTIVNKYYFLILCVLCGEFCLIMSVLMVIYITTEVTERKSIDGNNFFCVTSGYPFEYLVVKLFNKLFLDYCSL